jgi:hypothetical protein
VRAADVRSLVDEVRRLGFTLRDEIAAVTVGPVVVSGVLAEQLAKELGAGASPGAVVLGGASVPPNAEVLVRVIAGDPGAEDESLVRAASARGVEVVMVELWPQADWTRPFVVTPFVVECRAGEGFPIREIADRIVEATEHAGVLAARVPTLADATRASFVKQAVIRSALIGLMGARLGASRPLLVREQVRMVTRLRAVSSGTAGAEERPVLAGGAAAALASGFALRGVARTVRAVVPAPVAHAAIAAAGTLALAKAFAVFESRLRSE